MKSIVVCLAIITVSLTFTAHTYAEIDFSTARGIWLLNEGEGNIINDSSGNENHGELQGGTWVNGPDGPALSLDGHDDRVIIPDAESMYLEGAWTITAWAFVNTTENGYGHILGKRPAFETVANYAFRTSRSGTGWEAYFARDGWRGAWNQGSVKKNEWLYMTAVYDGEDTITIYENAEEIGSVGGIGGPGPRNDTDVNIGGWTNNTSETLDGMLYEVAIFASILEVEDINALMDKGLSSFVDLDPVNISFTMPAEVSVGEVLTATLNIADAVDLAGVQFDLHFNPTVLEVTDIQEGDLITGAGTFFQVAHFKSVPGEISGIRIARGSGIDGNGVLLKVDFKAKAAGVSTLEVRRLKLGTSVGSAIPAEVVSAEVEVKPRPDVTGDGKVDILDLVRITRHFGPASAAPVGLDINGDGNIDILDLILVARHLGT